MLYGDSTIDRTLIFLYLYSLCNNKLLLSAVSVQFRLYNCGTTRMIRRGKEEIGNCLFYFQSILTESEEETKKYLFTVYIVTVF